MHEHFAEFGDKLPQELHDELDSLEERLRST
jgi:GTP-dependent phosphoenolpyruvate carboxykinase